MEAAQTSNHTGDFDKWCDDTRTHMLSITEWTEMMAIPAIRESWGLEPDETPEHFAKLVYAAKFYFHSGTPGYVGISTSSRGMHLPETHLSSCCVIKMES